MIFFFLKDEQNNAHIEQMHASNPPATRGNELGTRVGAFPESRGVVGGKGEGHGDEESDVALKCPSVYFPRSSVVCLVVGVASCVYSAVVLWIWL